MKHFIFIYVLSVAIVGTTGMAYAEDIPASVKFSVRDSGNNGTPDVLTDSGFFNGLIRNVSSNQDRALVEFDISSLAGQTILDAAIVGQIANNNSSGTWPRTYEFDLYSGNGLAELADYDVAGDLAGNAVWLFDDLSAGVPINLDITALLQGLVDGSASHAGFRIRPTSSNLFPSLLQDGIVLSVEYIPEPTTALLLLGGSIALIRRR